MCIGQVELEEVHDLQIVNWELGVEFFDILEDRVMASHCSLKAATP